MKKIIGTILIAVGAVVSFIGLFLPYGKLGISFMGETEDESLGSMMGGDYLKVPVLYWLAIVVAIAAIVLGFLKKYKPSAILGIVSGVFMILILIINGKKGLVDQMMGGQTSLFGIDVSSMVTFSKGAGWFFFLLSGIALVAGGVITMIGQDDSVGSYNQFNQNNYSDPYQNQGQF